MSWAINGTPDTLTGTADELNITDMTSTIFNVHLIHLLSDDGSSGHRKRYGTTTIDTGSNYSERTSLNGGSDLTFVTQDRNVGDNFSGRDRFQIQYMINIASEEKLSIYFTVGQGTPGASNVPNREEAAAKWVNTSTQYDVIRDYNAVAGDYEIDSNLSALGTD